MILGMATTVGFNRNDFWMTREERKKSLRCTPCDYNNFMSKSRFELILKHLSFTTRAPPTCRDKFWHIREMIEVWNEKAKNVFHCSWVVCLDKSTSLWLNWWTCLGWIFIPRKAWSMGNKYHAMWCGESSIMFVIDLVEGKDWPKELPLLDPEKKGPTVSLLSLFIWHSGNSRQRVLCRSMKKWWLFGYYGDFVESRSGTQCHIWPFWASSNVEVGVFLKLWNAILIVVLIGYWFCKDTLENVVLVYHSDWDLADTVP